MPYLALAVNNYRLMENIVNKFILWVWEKFLPLCAKNKPKKRKKMEPQDFVHKEKRLAYLLRHDRDYPLSPNGWREVDDLVRHHGFSMQELCDIVAGSSKRRFEFSEDGYKIRALQGHSVSVDLALEKAVPPQSLFHGTTRECFPLIMEGGICKMQRQYVHLSPDIETAENVALRRKDGCAVFEVAAQRMYEEGFVFYQSKNGVWLVENVPPQYLTVKVKP